MGQAAYQPAKALRGASPGAGRGAPQPAKDGAATPRHPFKNDNDHGADEVITVDVLNSFCKLVGELDGDSAALIKEAGLPPTVGLASGDKVSLHAVGELFEICAKRLNCPDFGLRLAEKQIGCSVMKPLEQLVSHAPTMLQAMRCSIDHMAAYSSGLRLSLLPVPGRGMQRLRFEVLLDDYYQFPQLVEQLALLTHKTVQELTGGFARVRAVSFSHTQIGPKWDYARRFSVPVSFDQDFDEVLFADSDLQTHLVQHDETIFTSE